MTIIIDDGFGITMVRGGQYSRSKPTPVAFKVENPTFERRWFWRSRYRVASAGTFYIDDDWITRRDEAIQWCRDNVESHLWWHDDPSTFYFKRQADASAFFMRWG